VVLVVACVLVAVVALVLFRFRDEAEFGVKLAVPGPAYSGAEDRTTGPAAEAQADVLLPAVSSADGPTGTDPAIELGAVLELPSPSALADPPGAGPVLVSTLDGRVHAVDLAAGTSEVVLDLTDRVTTGGERGLLGLAVDPDGERLYVDYTDSDGDTDVRSWPLGRDGRPGGDDAGTLHLEIGQPFPNHNGGNLVFGPDGALWIATGDGGGAGDRGEVAQDPGSLLGKMLRVVPDPDGGVTAPASNPDWERPEVWGIGLRNPWRWSFDRATNRLWIADVGQNTIEEVTVIDPDAPRPNLGWDILEGNNRYEGEPSDDLTDPVVTYGRDDGCSITGGYVYRGDDIPSLHGWYLFSDYCQGWIRAVPADEPETPPVELVQSAGNVISFGELEDGDLVVLTTDGIRRILQED
jgi:glucose/arabinose dehydrogenase